MVQSKYPENEKELDSFVTKLERIFDDSINSIKTLAEKIKLDTNEGVRTNPLYIEMFGRIMNGKFVDVHMVCVLLDC